MSRSTNHRRAQRGIAAFTAFSLFWSTVLPAQTLILPDGNTATQVHAAGNVANVNTATVRGTNAFNSFSRFNVGSGDTVNLHLPNGTQNLLNLVHDERTTSDGVLNSIRNGQVGGTLYFANPHGIVVGPSGVVNTGTLHAVTPTQDFMRRFFSAPGEPSTEATAQLMNGSAPLNPDGLISIQGKVNTVTGATLDAGQISVAGEIRSTAPAEAGFADAVNLSGLDTAAGVTLEAGEISLQAAGDVDVSGTLAAEGRDGVNGGDIAVRAGRDIRLEAPARISVSGRGAGSDGGRVVVLADKTTHLAAGATIEARGGDQSGDGGFIELSARERVQLAGGRLDAGAPHGRGGEVLLDPPSFDLNNGSASPGAPSTLVFSGSSLTLAADDYIRLDNFSISTRVADGSGNSTADSGSITFTADRIELINGSTQSGPR